jgi:glucose-6-phosphate 1-dehydrogenase
MIRKLAILGATGDLAARYLLPALAALRAAGELGDDFRLVAIGREDRSDETFRNWAAAQLDRHAKELPAKAKSSLAAATRYHQADVTDPSSLAAVVHGGEPLAAYLALPPFVFPGAVSALHRAGTAQGSIVVLEKPFGEDLDEAIELNRLLASLYPEQAIFRVDHFLAMTTVQNILGTRLANRVLEPIWNSAHISMVDIVWDESLALEGRAGYYDGVGALKDMLQNHLLQILCLVAMEPPITLGDRDLRDRKVDVLRSIRPIEPRGGGPRDLPRPLHGRADRRANRSCLCRRAWRGPATPHGDVRGSAVRGGQLALGRHGLPASDRKGAAARPQGGGRALPARAPSPI